MLFEQQCFEGVLRHKQLKFSHMTPLCNVCLFTQIHAQKRGCTSANSKLEDFFKRSKLKVEKQTDKQKRIRSSSDALDFSRVCELNRLQDLSHRASKQYLSTPFGRHSSSVDLEQIMEEKSRLVNSTKNVPTHLKITLLFH